MGKHEMRTLNFHSRATSSSHHRPILASILFVLCIPIFFYHLVPSCRSASDAFISDITTRIRSQTSKGSFCTQDIGDAQCCTLYIAAAPCVDECRKQHVDRATFTLTKEYEECADVCLAAYTAICRPAPEALRLGS